MSDYGSCSGGEGEDDCEVLYSCLKAGPKHQSPVMTKGYQVLSTEAIMDFMRQSLSEANSVVQLPNLTTLRYLLNYYKWDKGRLLEAYYEKTPKQLSTLAKIDLELNMESPQSERLPIPVPIPTHRSVLSRIARVKTRKYEDCSICLLETPNAELYGLRCEHRFCVSCWKAYLKEQIMGEGLGDGPLCCPAYNCKLLVDEETVLKFIEDEPGVKGKYQYLITNSFVKCNRSLAWCQNPGCENAIQVKDVDMKPNPVRCSCGFEFCFHCPEGLHDPITCELLRKWKLKIRDGSESASWLTINTKNCPKCATPIEKNGGCNHMSCRSTACCHEFCWICLEDWKLHNDSFHCNRFPGAKHSARTDKLSFAAANLERYLHYFNQYNAHMNSLKLETRMDSAVKNRMQECMSLGLSWVEVQFLNEAVTVLRTCRQMLIHTYVFAYYIENCNQKDIFEANQADLQRAVEELSGFLENELSQEEQKEVDKLQEKVLNRAKYCDLRSRVLLNHVNEGYDREWWKFIF